MTALQICNNQLMVRARNAIASVTKFSVSLHRPNKPLLLMQKSRNQASTAAFTHHCTAYMTCFLQKWRKVADILYCCQDTLTLAQRHSSAAAAAVQKCFHFLHFGAAPEPSPCCFSLLPCFPVARDLPSCSATAPASTPARCVGGNT